MLVSGVSARSKTLGRGGGSMRQQLDGQLQGWTEDSVCFLDDIRCHWEMSRARAHGRWFWRPAVILHGFLLSSAGVGGLMHLPTFVTLQWRLKTHKKRKGLLIRTKKDKCLSACPHQLAKQSAGGFCFYSLSNASPSRHTQVLLALAGSHEEETEVIKIKRGNFSL